MNNYDVYRDRVDISLEKYEAVRDEIIRLEKERANFEHKYENLKSFIDQAHLPGEIIADGKLTNMNWCTENNPEDLTVSYKVMVTICEEDAKKYGY